MATGTKRWAVRDDYDGSPYLLFLGNKPRKPKAGWNKSQSGFFTDAGKKGFEGFFPQSYHLKRGGGPVLIRFADEG